jgi:hypothetical protein
MEALLRIGRKKLVGSGKKVMDSDLVGMSKQLSTQICRCVGAAAVEFGCPQDRADDMVFFGR